MHLKAAFVSLSCIVVGDRRRVQPLNLDTSPLSVYFQRPSHFFHILQIFQRV